MQDILLLAAVAAVFVFGYFCVKKLDLFFDDSDDRFGDNCHSHSFRCSG